MGTHWWFWTPLIVSALRASGTNLRVHPRALMDPPPDAIKGTSFADVAIKIGDSLRANPDVADRVATYLMRKSSHHYGQQQLRSALTDTAVAEIVARVVKLPGAIKHVVEACRLQHRKFQYALPARLPYNDIMAQDACQYAQLMYDFVDIELRKVIGNCIQLQDGTLDREKLGRMLLRTYAKYRLTEIPADRSETSKETYDAAMNSATKLMKKIAVMARSTFTDALLIERRKREMVDIVRRYVLLSLPMERTLLMYRASTVNAWRNHVYRHVEPSHIDGTCRTDSLDIRARGINNHGALRSLLFPTDHYSPLLPPVRRMAMGDNKGRPELSAGKDEDERPFMYQALAGSSQRDQWAWPSELVNSQVADAAWSLLYSAQRHKQPSSGLASDVRQTALMEAVHLWDSLPSDVRTNLRNGDPIESTEAVDNTIKSIVQCACTVAKVLPECDRHAPAEATCAGPEPVLCAKGQVYNLRMFPDTTAKDAGDSDEGSGGDSDEASGGKDVVLAVVFGEDHDSRRAIEFDPQMDPSEALRSGAQLPECLRACGKLNKLSVHCVSLV
jgi:hypothetical protein